MNHARSDCCTSTQPSPLSEYVFPLCGSTIRWLFWPAIDVGARKVDCTEEFLAANHFVSSSRNFHVPTTVFGWKAAATYVISPSRARPAICCCTRASICETKCRCADCPQRCFLG